MSSSAGAARRRARELTSEKCAAYLGNPFEGANAVDRRDVDRELQEWIDGGKVPEMLAAATNQETSREQLAIAVGHHQACRHPDSPERVLTRAELPPDVAAQLGLNRGALLPLLMASGRCYRALGKVIGEAPALTEAKRGVWAACFGSTLEDAQALTRVLRRHHVLLLGESGSGKEGLAEAVQAATPGPADGSAAPAVQLNCAAIVPTLVDSELFGHAKGAFTGATKDSRGRLREADGGSLFLDEVAELSTDAQARLLRAIEKKQVRPVGAEREERADVRFVSATHEDLEERVKERRFRHDLRARLAGTVIHVPPLRARVDDLELLAVSLAKEALGDGDGVEIHKNVVRVWAQSEEARRHPWTGNVRELRSAVERLLLGLEPLPRRTAFPEGTDEAAAAAPRELVDSRWPLRDLRRWYVRRTLDAVGGHQLRAAQRLGVDPKTLARWLKEER